jgi:hypothetical protein
VPELDTQSCVTQAIACTGNASTARELASCQDGLQTCLAGVSADAGLPAFPTFDAGAPPTDSWPPLPDAGLNAF